MSAVTGYQAAKIINHLFAEDGIERELKPQMIYNYINAKKIQTVDGPVKNNKVQKLIPLDEVGRFYQDLRDGKISMGTKDSTAVLADQLRSMIK